MKALSWRTRVSGEQRRLQMYWVQLDASRKIKVDNLSASEKSSTSSNISWESCRGPAVIHWRKCPFIFFMCVCVNMIWLMSWRFCTFKVGSIFHVSLTFLLLLLSNPASSGCHCLLSAQFQARSVPGKLLRVTVVWCHIFCYGRALFTWLVHPWWTSICSQQGCKCPPSPRKPEAHSAQPGSKSIRGCPNPHCAPFYSVWRKRKIHSETSFAIHKHIWLRDPCLLARFLHFIRKERRRSYAASGVKSTILSMKRLKMPPFPAE